MIVPDKDKGIIRFIFGVDSFCFESNPFLRRKTKKNLFSNCMMMARSIIRGDCPCIF